MQVVETYWQKPVTVRRQDGLEQTFLCVEDSLEILENGWPKRGGRHRDRAISLCRSVLRRECSTEAAREAFIAACIEAAMPPVFMLGRTAPERPLISGLQ